MTRMLRRTLFGSTLFARGLRGRMVACHLLLLTLGIVLAMMPWTEHLCTWDGFIWGGQDMEFGLLACSAGLGLALLLASWQPLRPLRTVRFVSAPPARPSACLLQGQTRSFGPHPATYVPPLKI